MKVTSVATYERARRLANISLYAIDLQCRRLSLPDPIDNDFVFRKWADFDFLIVCLIRLRRAAKLAGDIPEIKPSLASALKNFDAALPHLKRMRNVAEHIGDYALDKGFEKPKVPRQLLEVSFLSEDGLTLEWLGTKLNALEALAASQNLLKAIKEVSFIFTSNA